MEEAIVSAVVGELFGRTISFLIDTFSKRMERPRPSGPASLDSLGGLLLRVGAIVEDAEGRRITNRAALQQLSTLRHQMQRGHFTLDAFRCHEASDQGHESGRRHSSALSRFNPAKRLRICGGGGGQQSAGDLQRAVASLEASVQNAAELILLSGGYPRLARQPYSMYLLVDSCMFGRRMEMERVFDFLLRGARDPGAEHLGVLPVVGPANVGKSTLVEHACADERARDHFSRIVLLGGGGDLAGKDMAEALAHGAGVIKHQNRAESGGGRVLIVLELDRDISDEFWQRLHSTVKARFGHGSKMIVTSRSDRIARFGTALPLRLRFLTPEAYWYFFKARTFGSVDVAMEHPKLASIAMDMAGEMSGCFMGATIFGGMLRSSLDIGTWSLALATYREFKQRNPFLSGPNPADPWALHRPILLPTANKASPGYFVVSKKYETASAAHGDSEAPKVSVQDVMLGRARPQGKFDALAWRSHIPPHYNYVFSCEQRVPASAVSTKKRTRKVSM